MPVPPHPYVVPTSVVPQQSQSLVVKVWNGIHFFLIEVLCLILAMAFIKALSTLIERFSIECNQRERVINLKDGEFGTRTEKQRN